MPDRSSLRRPTGAPPMTKEVIVFFNRFDLLGDADRATAGSQRVLGERCGKYEGWVREGGPSGNTPSARSIQLLVTLTDHTEQVQGEGGGADHLAGEVGAGMQCAPGR